MSATILEFPGAVDIERASAAVVDCALVCGRVEGLKLAHGLAVAEFDRLCQQRPVNLAAIEVASRISTAIYEACKVEAGQ